MPDPVTLQLTDPDDPALQSCLRAYARFLTRTLPEEGPDPFPLPLPDAADYRPPRGAVLLARQADLALGCVCLHGLSPERGEVKRLYVAPKARGQGLARRLMRAIEDQARSLGYTSLVLDTNHRLTAAVALYLSDGWAPCPPYSGPPATRWFAKSL